VGEAVPVSADIFADGHDVLAARSRTRVQGSRTWTETPLTDQGDDRFGGVVHFDAVGPHELVIDAWIDRHATWRHDVRAKVGAGQDVATELEEGSRLLDALVPHLAAVPAARVAAAAATLRRRTCSLGTRLDAGLDDAVAAAVSGIPLPGDVTTSTPRPVDVERALARFSAWYELFPRSEGGLSGAAKRLAAVAEMGFDVVYLPPIHPIGRTARKGRDNTLVARPTDVGSPWAIGSEEGGHTAVHPDLGTVEDLDALVAEARALGMEVALDYALQCSPDHPWVREHPEWFHHRPDGTIKHAENPPKRYEDIYPVNFWPAEEDDRRALWNACEDVLEHWIAHGIAVFRVDNPHTKPFAFWAEVLTSVRRRHPEVLFLAEAFTRPKMMAMLARVGFTQSYTYFTWRTAKAEIVEYLTEIAHGPKADYMRPNFWPNTPDILAAPLRDGPPAAFRLRLVLAALLVPSYGIYSGYELCENVPASETNEEYFRSEKYEVKDRDWAHPDSLAPFVTRINEIRRRHPALGELRNIRFHSSRNDNIVAWSKHTDDGSDVVLVVVNLDPYAAHDDTLSLDLGLLGLPWDLPFQAHDELTGTTYTWAGPHPYVRLDPVLAPAHVLHLRPLPAPPVA